MSNGFNPYAYAARQGTQAQSSPAFDPYQYAVNAVAANAAQPAPVQQPSAFESDVVRPVGLLGRAAASGLAGLPLMAMDAGVAARNLIGDWYHKEMGEPATPDYELPSQMFQDSLTAAGFPVPRGLVEKGTGAVESMLAGSFAPVPEAEGNLPEGFQTAAQRATAERMQAVRNGMERGYRIPPATTNPTLLNKGIETLGGKLATQQAASWANQQVTNSLAAEALGLDPNVPLTPAATQAARSDAAQAYQAIDKIPKISLDPKFKAAIGAISGKFNKLAEEVPTLASKDLQPVAEDLAKKDSISGSAALGAIRSLRDKADAAFRAGNGTEGTAYKQMARELENAVDRGLSDLDSSNKDLVQGFRTARQRIAVAHEIEDAMNPGTGNVIAQKLGRSLSKGSPLTGPLRTIAEFANAAPKAVGEPLTSPVHHLNLAGEMLGGGLGALAHGPIGAAIGTAAYPAARAAAKWAALNPGQALAIPTETNIGANLLRGVPGLYEGAQEGNQE